MSHVVHVPARLADRFVGVDHENCLIIRDDLGLVVLTPCCNAYGKGADSGVVCRYCYAPVDVKHGYSSAAIAIAREELTVLIDPPQESPDERR